MEFYRPGGLAATPVGGILVADTGNARVVVLDRFGAQIDETARLPSVPVDLAVEEHFDPPLQDLEQAAFASRALANRLLEVLGPWGGRPHLVVVEAGAGRVSRVDPRSGEVETLEYQRDRGFSLTVYFGPKKGSASSSSRQAFAASGDRASGWISNMSSSIPRSRL